MEPIFHNVIFLVVLLFCLAGCRSLAFPASVLKRKARKSKRHPGAKSQPTGDPEDSVGLNLTAHAIRQERIRGGFTLFAWGLLLILLRPNLGLRQNIQSKQESDSSLRAMVLRESQKYMRQEPIVGMVVAVMNGDEELVIGLGRRDLSTDLPPDGDTVFELASLTKLFTGTLLAYEIRMGNLALTNLVVDHLPEGITMPESISKSLTFGHLVTHTSGFPGRGDNLKSKTGLFSMIRGSNPYRGYTQEDFWEDVPSVQLKSSPGEKFRYSNFGTSLFGTILANQAGTTYEDRVRERIWKPLGMNDTAVVPSPDQASRRAGGYRSVISMGRLLLGFAAEPWLVPDVLAPEGGMLSTANDMLKFLKANANLDHPDLGPAMKLAQAHLYQWTDYYSLGINWFRMKFDGSILVQHEGRSTGQRSFIGIIEGQPIGIVILSNSQIPVDDLGKVILRKILAMNKG